MILVYVALWLWFTVVCSVLLLLSCRSKRGVRLSLGSGGGGSIGGSDSIDDLGRDPADFPGAAAQGASAAKRTAFLEGIGTLLYCAAVKLITVWVATDVVGGHDCVVCRGGFVAECTICTYA
jgi:hypothetical protein